jgi:hypothetical protein
MVKAAVFRIHLHTGIGLAPGSESAILNADPDPGGVNLAEIEGENGAKKTDAGKLRYHKKLTLGTIKANFRLRCLYKSFKCSFI